MPDPDLKNNYDLNEIVQLYDSEGRKVRGRIDSMYQKYGTVIYVIDDLEADSVISYHRAEAAIEKEGSPSGHQIKVKRL